MAESSEWGRQLWVADQYAPRCGTCGARFHMVRRRHHCRQCGQIFCGDCLVRPSARLAEHSVAGARSSLVKAQPERRVKVCRECHRIMQQRELGRGGKAKALTSQELRQTQFVRSPLCSSNEMGGSSVAFSTEGVRNQAKQTRVDEKDVILGVLQSDASDPQLLSSTTISSLAQISFPNLLTHPENLKQREVTYGIKEIPSYSINSMSQWAENLLHRAQKAKLEEHSSKREDTCCSRVFAPRPVAKFAAINRLEAHKVFPTSFFSPSPRDALLQLERESSTQLIKRASRMFVNEMVASGVIEDAKKYTDSDNDDKRIWLTEWIANICDISWRIVSQTAMVLYEHIAKQFDIICIPDGQLVDTEIISGLAFVQTVASKRMKTFVQSPTILVLSGCVGITLKPGGNFLEYVEGYEGHLEKLYQRIYLWNPSVIVVEGGMHHYLQKKILQDSRATLILHCGKEVINRLAYCCNADIVDNLQYVSPADLLNPSILGSCEIFQMIDVNGKPVCVFKGLESPLFTTVILRGDEQARLEVVKKVLINSVMTACHLALQSHLVFDLCISLQAPDADLRVKSSSCLEESYAADDLEESLRLISQSPRKEDRAETLSMNFGVSFPDEVKLMDDQHDDLMWDNIVVNTVFLGSPSGFNAEDGSVTPAGALNCDVRQSREVFPFYSDGDETVLEYLIARVKEENSLRFITHADKRVWIKTTTELSNNVSCQARRMDNGNSETSSYCSVFDLSSVNYDSDTGSGFNSSKKFRRGEELQHMFPPVCKASCKECFKNDFGSFSYCSVHMLSLSWGSFLEFCVYGSTCFTLSCGHSLSTSLSLSIVFFPDSRREVTVSIMVEPVKSYTIVPLFRFLPAFPDVAKLYLKEEIEELRQVLGEIKRAIKSVKAAPASVSSSPSSLFNSQQPFPSSAVDSLSSTSPSPSTQPFLQNEQLTSTIEEPAAAIEDDKDKASVLLRRVDELMEQLRLIKSNDEAITMRLDCLSSLVNEFMEWHNTVLSSAEQRGGKRPVPMDVSKFNESNWAYSVRDKMGLRLHEPTCLVAAALQATSMGGCSTESSMNEQVSTTNSETQRGQHVQDELGTPRNCNTTQTNDDGLLLSEEVSPLSLEDTMKAVLGVETQDHPSMLSTASQPPPSTLSFIRSTSEALDILLGCRTHTPRKATLRHKIDAWVPFDKTDQVIVTVEVMFPEQFAALRHLYTKGKDFDLIQSLRRCRPFKPQGGKTNSDFFITRDERFVLKQLKQAELRHFVRFGPSYFTYLAQMYNRGQDALRTDDIMMAFGSTLVKIFGVFSLHMKSNKKFTDRRSEIRYFALMENVFYSRHADVMYDLKGSQRNRTAPGGSSVLLDQDLVKSLEKGSFFYCANDAKSFLMDSLTNDSHLLSSSSIMDYSLIVGLNEEKEEIYLGVVDYLHPYTGAKVIESKVKAGLETVLGYPGRDPTIIDPLNYRVRFTKWMKNCFCGVPEKTFAVRRAIAKKSRRGEN